MKKIFLTSVAIFTLSSPAFATVDIAKNASDPGCTNSVLKTYTGPTDLEADYTANTINLNFYSDENTVYSTGTCTYDGGIELPEEDPTRTGYTFDGWQVRRAAANNNNQSGGNNQTTFDLSTLASSVNTDGFMHVAKSVNGMQCDSYDTRTDNWVEGCSNNEFTGLSDGEWRIAFSYGTVKGTSQCRFESEGECYEDEETGEERCDDDTYTCYCQATGFDPENDGTFLSVESSSWQEYSIYDGMNGSCNYDCASECADYMMLDSYGRIKMFGITE